MRPSHPNVGTQLREFRERRGWSLRRLAERSGLSVNAISRIERGENSPTIVTLQKIAVALNLPIGNFFTLDARPRPLRQADILANSVDGRVVEAMRPALTGYALYPYRITLAAHADLPPPVAHVGEEWLHVLGGALHCEVGPDSFDLFTGDSLLFQGSLPHRWWALGPEAAVFFVCLQAENGFFPDLTTHFTA
jgi:transcriptional regulator with XRE-family HTH domain